MFSSSIVLLSAGLDSTAAFHWARTETDIMIALTLDYGQRSAQSEIKSSQKLCEAYDIKHQVISLPWFKEMNSALFKEDSILPSVQPDQLDDYDVTSQSAKSVWVPNRNGVLLNVAAAFAEDYLAKLVVVGFNVEEAQTFPDNSIHFLAFINESLKYSTQDKVSIEAPHINMNKTEIVSWLLEKNYDLSHIWSCYDDGEKMCGQCESCSRLKRALHNNQAQEWVEKLF